MNRMADPPVGLPADLARAFEKRDLLTVAWDYLRHIRSSPDHEKLASPAASIMRVILALGGEDEVAAEKLEEAIVIGGAINGLPPVTERGWEVAARVFDPMMLAHLRAWRPEDGWSGHLPESREDWDARWSSVKSDSGEVPQPLLGGDRVAGEEDVTGLIEDQDGTGPDF